MYVWIGLILNETYEKSIRSICRNVNKKYLVNEQSFTLPQHISLKTSFFSDDYKKIIEYISSLYENNKKMALSVQNITMLSNKVIWLDILETNQLREMHDILNKELNNRFNIPLSGFDGEKFKFHSTLFQELEENKNIVPLYNDLKEKIKCPLNVEIDRVCIGLSEIGKVGTYKVVKDIKFK